MTSSLPPMVHPGDTIAFDITIKVSAGMTASSAKVRFSGLFVDSLLLPVPGAGDFGYTIQLHLSQGAYQGVINVEAIATIGTVADSARLAITVGDDGPPTLNLRMVSPGAEPGDTVVFVANAHDADGITRLDMHVTGAVIDSGSNLYAYQRDVEKVYRYGVPPATRMGDSITVSVAAYDGFGNGTPKAVAAAVIDFHPPTLSAALSGGRFDSILPFRLHTLFTGDTLLITVHARDRKLGWIGWRVLNVGADSVAIRDTVADTVLRMPVTKAMDGQQHLVRAFARDSVGNLTETEGYFRDFVDGVRRVFHILPGLPDRVDDIAYSEAAGRAVVVSNGSATVLSVDPLHQVGVAATPRGDFGVDVAPGSDTAWVGARTGTALDGRRLYAIPLSVGTPTVARTIDVVLSPIPTRMRLTSTGQAVITSELFGGQPSDTVTFVNLGSGRQTNRAVTGFPAGLTASLDHTLLLGSNSGELVPYDVAADSFGTMRQIYSYVGAAPAVDAVGSQILVNDRLYDRSLNYVRTVGAGTYENDGSMFSADGQYVYFFRWPGLHKVRRSDGALVEKIFSPDGYPSRWLELPDRQLILVIGFSSIAVIDLSPAGVLP